MEETKYQLLHPGAEDLVLLLAETLFQINCPVCGAKICRASEGSQMTTFCRKCRHLLDIEVSQSRAGEDQLLRRHQRLAESKGREGHQRDEQGGRRPAPAAQGEP